MSERERLIKLIEQCSCHYSPPCTGECGECHNVEMYDRNIEHIADNLLANGVIMPPCKVGDTVYQIIPKCSPAFGMCPYNGGYGTARCDKGPCKAHIKEISFSLSDIENIGKTVFLTREEAEKALEGMQ